MEDWEYHCICPDGEDCPVHGKGGVELLEQARADNAALVKGVREYIVESVNTREDWIYLLHDTISHHGERGAALLAELMALPDQFVKPEDLIACLACHTVYTKPFPNTCSVCSLTAASIGLALAVNKLLDTMGIPSGQ